MHSGVRGSSLQFEKQRAAARLHLSNGDIHDGFCFLGALSVLGDGPELISDVLNAGDGFLPFEVTSPDGSRTTLINPAHIVMVALPNNEASRDPGHMVARAQSVSLLLSTGERVRGEVRVHQPVGHDRLSDWTRQADVFRYIETAGGTFLVNAAHIVHLSETEP